MAKAKYGIIFKPQDMGEIPSVPLAASVAFKNKGGKFMFNNAGSFELADSGDTELAGWADVGEFTSSSTAGTDKVPLVTSLEAIFEIPSDAAFTASDLTGLIGDNCDLRIVSGIQCADIGESTEDVLIIVGGDVSEQTLYVKMNPVKKGLTGVA